MNTRRHRSSRALLWILAASAGALIAGTVAIGAQSSDAWEKAAMAPIQVGEWSRPQRGWLYVLDPQPEAGSPAGRIWLLDPASGEVMGHVDTGTALDFALSADGARLYVASKAKDRFSNLAIIDTATGTILKVLTVEGRVVTNGVPAYSGMGVSGDGLSLRVLTYDGSPDGDFDLVAIDTKTGNLLPNPVNLGKCGFGRFIDYPNENQFDYLCSINNRIRQVNIDPQTQQPDHQVVTFPWLRRLGIADAFPARDGENISIIRGDGAAFTMNVNTGNFASTKLESGVEGMALPADWPISPDGTRVYVGYDLYPTKNFYMNFERSPDAARIEQAYELRAIDTRSWRTLGHTSGKGAPFWSAAVSPDGKFLYASSPQNHAVVVFDAQTLHELRIIPLGGMPALMLAAP
jgi:DNA-binding beta-propeller fold protein YncE